MNSKWHLHIVGVLQILLALAHVTFPRRFRWKEEFASVSLLNRQMFYIHAFFLCLTLICFGSLNLICADELLQHGRLARVVLLGIGTFWAIRLFFQIFVYERQLWLGNSANTFIHLGFTLMWIYFSGTYFWAAWKGEAL